MKDAFIQTLTSHAQANKDIFLLVGDLGFGMVESFIERCPRQFVNVGIAEQNMIGVATGLALEGKIVFAYSLAPFATLRCLEQIRNDAHYHKANVKVVGMGAGFSYGALGYTHHALEDVAIISTLGGVNIYIPCEDREASYLTEFAIDQAGPCYLRLDKSSVADVSAKLPALGEPRILRQGSDVTIFGYGGILSEALTAAERLQKDSISVRVIHFPFLKPLNEAAVIQLLKETPHIISLEEHVLTGGIGDKLASLCIENQVFPKSFRRFGVDSLIESKVGTQSYLRQHFHLSADDVVRYVQKLWGTR